MNTVYVLTVENHIPDCEPFEVVGVYATEELASAELRRQYDAEYERCQRYNEIYDHSVNPLAAYIETAEGEVDFAVKGFDLKSDVTEVCPECGHENRFAAGDGTWAAKCAKCGTPMLLCDKCHSENGPAGRGCVSGSGCPHQDELRRAREVSA